jgi:hypothetical protein
MMMMMRGATMTMKKIPLRLLRSYHHTPLFKEAASLPVALILYSVSPFLPLSIIGSSLKIEQEEGFLLN